MPGLWPAKIKTEIGLVTDMFFVHAVSLVILRAGLFANRDHALIIFQYPAELAMRIAVLSRGGEQGLAQSRKKA